MRKLTDNMTRAEDQDMTEDAAETITGIAIAADGTVTELSAPTGNGAFFTAKDAMGRAEVRQAEGQVFEYPVWFLVDEGGRQKGLPRNDTATSVLMDAVFDFDPNRDSAVGTVVIFGQRGTGYGSVHPEVIQYVRETSGQGAA